MDGGGSDNRGLEVKSGQNVVAKDVIEKKKKALSIKSVLLFIPKIFSQSKKIKNNQLGFP